FIRSRITRYVEAAAKIREYLAEQKKLHPELAEPIGELEKIALEVDTRFSARKEKMKTPDHVARMNGDFRRDVLDYDGADALDRVKNAGPAWVELGDNRDELWGGGRGVIRRTRQRGGRPTAAEARMGPIAAELRAKCGEARMGPAGHEGNRH